MDIQNLACVAIVILGLGLFLFAGKIFDSSSDGMPDFVSMRSRGWLSGTWRVFVFITRIIGIMIAGIAVFLLFGSY